MKLQGRNLTNGTRGDDVRLLHRELRLLGFRLIPDATEIHPGIFGPHTLVAVREFQAKAGLKVTGIVDEATARVINEWVDRLPGGGSVTIVDGDAQIYIVQGKVTSPDSAGVGGLRVLIVDRNIGGDVPLAETVTDVRGLYSVRFEASSFREQGKQHPDEQARVFAGPVFLASSEVRYDATPQETLNVAIPAGSKALASEYETLIAGLAPHFRGRLRDLEESDSQQDITYLANKSGWDARAVAMAALADQFSSHDDKIAPAFYYALFRAGLPANADTLYQASTETVRSIWKRAVEQGVIPRRLEDQIPNAAGAFQSLSTARALDSRALAGASTLKEMLHLTFGDDTQRQQQFADLYTRHRSNPSAFWDAVGQSFGEAAAKRLRVDGQLGFLTLNNAPLMQAIHSDSGGIGLTDPQQLAQAGYHRAAKWHDLVSAQVPVPQEIPGDTPEVKRKNYANYLAAQVRLSYPTAAVAEMVNSGDLRVNAPGQVHTFLTEHQGKFEIGMQPVQQYIARNQLEVADETVRQVQRLERLYQLTPSDQAMGGLLQRGVDAAFHVVRYDKDAFIQTFAADVGGSEIAAQTYDRSVQVHNAVLNIAISYLTARNGITLGGTSLKPSDAPGQVLQPMPKGPTAENAGDVLAYPTLEGLFGSMDFCACDHCRSVLSPAAYLVDLLHFIDQPTPPAGTENPQTVLLDRRPDVQHLPLTCENTNTALPYIDVVNETLEYFIANNVQKLSLHGYAGHDTDGMASEDLLASPQFVMDSAYTTLGSERFPTPLPFHQPLENLRRYFDKFGVPLPLAMERLRKGDDFERGANPYGWRDVLMEEIGISRPEHEILTGSITVPLWRMYGFPAGTSDAGVIAALSNAKQFTRRVGISYEELVAILCTRFVNPGSDLIPKLERLGVPFATLKALKDGTITDSAFDALLPTGAGKPDPKAYGGDIKAWVKQDANYERIMGLITLTDPTGNLDPCNFDHLEFRYAKPVTNPADTSTRLGAAEFVRLLRFIRLWKKMAWTVEQTDAAICAFFRADLAPLGASDIDTVNKLDTGFLILLPRIGGAARVMKALNLTPKRDLLPLLACWSEIGAHGDGALYRQMFLNPALLNQDDVFADNGYGEFLQSGLKLADHGEALRSAFNLTADEYDRILTALFPDASTPPVFDTNTPLTLPNIGAIYRHGFLARKLRLSVRELLLLIELTGLDPFAAPDPVEAPMMQLVSLVQALKDRSLKTAVALYLIWNQDLSGKSAPEPAQVAQLARTLRGDFAAIEDQFAAAEDPGGDIARARMALVYGQEAAGAFFALLDDTLVVDVAYTHPAPALEAAITAADSRIVYDDFQHRLSHAGVVTAAQRDTLQAVAGISAAFQAAVDTLFARSQDALGSFFARHSELKPLYDTYITSIDPPATRRAALLAAFRPELSRRRKRQQALQRLSATAAVDPSFTQALLDPSTAAPYPLHAAGHTGQPALNDVLALETPGLAARFFFRDTATGDAGLTVPAAANLDYSAGVNPLPANPTSGAAISGIWSGQVEAPEAGFYNIVVETDTAAVVTLALGGQARPLTRNGNVHRNTDPLELKAGTLYEITLTAEKVKDTLRIQWETPKRARQVIPARHLYPPTIFTPFSSAYVRLLKATSLAVGLGLTAGEIAHFATHADELISGDGWLNALPVSGNPTVATAAALLKPLRSLLDYARVKAAVSPGDESLLAILQDPLAATQNADSPLFTLTRWDRTSLNSVLAHFGGSLAGLTRFDLFRRVYDAFALIQQMGIPASALIEAATNEPAGATVRDLQAALRARYDAAGWRDLVQPINDAMRGLQRDALVAYILHHMRSNPATAHIDTADKLFEYFLMDVQMEPCMQTSRIRHALSSVQLFIERCLMNLEPRVSPASINATQWEWMKRYRVWEANRKVFLFPENWLEPELRDDKSPFFKEIESELLQSDITEESATTALLTYLGKLEEVAMLEPCGIYHVVGNPSLRTADVDHVIARTAGGKYYYRRHEHGYWTPWEAIKLDIEDNPVIPVVWRGRLLLFWLKILLMGPTVSSRPPAGKDLATMNTNDLQPDQPVQVKAVLCWSEYFNGKWQPTKTSDVKRPTDLGEFAAANPFDRFNLRLSVVEEGEDHYLRVAIEGEGYSTFLLYNTQGLPVREEEVAHDVESMFIAPRYLDTHTDLFSIWYYQAAGGGLVPGFGGPTLQHGILRNASVDRTIATSHPLANVWVAPFFYQDPQHVFFVTTAEPRTLFFDQPFYGFTVNTGFTEEPVIPSLIFEIVPRTQIPPRLRGLAMTGPNLGVVDPVPVQRLVTEDAHLRQGLGTTGSVVYGDRQIGPLGAIPKVDFGF